MNAKHFTAKEAQVEHPGVPLGHEAERPHGGARAADQTGLLPPGHPAVAVRGHGPEGGVHVAAFWPMINYSFDVQAAMKANKCIVQQ